jgi:hypothetical protein
MEFKNADSWECIRIVINGGNNTNDGAINRIRKPGVRFNGSNTAANITARNNTFRSSSAGAGGCSVMGVLNTGTRLTAVSVPNYWDLYEMGNGEPVPTVEGGASFDWKPNGGLRSGACPGSPSVADQAVSAATSTLLTGSLIAIPPQGWQVGMLLRWTFSCSKTALGTALRTFYIRVGTTGTTADAIVATMATSVGTTAIDRARGVIEMTVRGPLGATCAGVAHLKLEHDLATTGFLTRAFNIIAATMATWNSTTAQQFVSVTFTSGASEVVTFQQMSAQCLNSANP